jgi:type IV pilus assembly protein PilM
VLKDIFPSGINARRPGLACEIMPAGVTAARRGSGGREFLSSFVRLPPGALSPGLKTTFFGNRAAVADAFRRALKEVSVHDGNLTLVIPDLSARVLVLEFDELPAKAAEVLPILRFRLRKLVPFEVEDAAIGYQVLSTKDDVVRALLAVVPAAVLAEYEKVVREAGYEPGTVLPSTLAALAAVDNDEAALLVNHNGNSVTTAITQGNELLLHRTLELAPPAFSHHGLFHEDLGAERIHGGDDEDLQRSVNVAIAYFEDNLGAPPSQVLACGFGGADELNNLFGDAAIPARDLVSTPSTGNATPIPDGVLAGVTGALAG